MDGLYWYVKTLQCGYTEHGVNDIAFHIKKHRALRAICFNFPLVRDKPLEAPAFMILFYCFSSRKRTATTSADIRRRNETLTFVPFMKLWHGNIIRITGSLGGDSHQKGRLVWSFGVFFVVSLNKLLSSRVEDDFRRHHMTSMSSDNTIPTDYARATLYVLSVLCTNKQYGRLMGAFVLNQNSPYTCIVHVMGRYRDKLWC